VWRSLVAQAICNRQVGGSNPSTGSLFFFETSWKTDPLKFGHEGALLDRYRGDMTEFVEIADRVWVARYEWADANVTAIGGERGLAVVDTHGSTAAGRIVLEDLECLRFGPVVHVVNSHWHWDHTFGNAAFRETTRDVPIHAHEEAARWLAEHGERMKQRFADDPDDLHRAEVAATEIVIPDQTFADTQSIDLGDRSLELMFLGRGHTSGDIVARVVDANVVIVADLIEESAKPWIGMDSWPLEWPITLDALLELVVEQTVVIPGHGSLVNRAFVRTQRDEIAQIVETIRTLAGLGVSADQASLQGEWPWEVDARIHNAITRGYEALSSE
jgi:glyoxylase-like metal-dependent hydrolase (beta-lactamase superfamily II)